MFGTVRLLGASLLALSALSAGDPAHATEAEAADAQTASSGPAARAVIDALDKTLLDVMKNGDKLGYEGRYAQLEPLIKHTFNVPLRTRIGGGAPWSGWTQDQRSQITDAFGRFIIATYARRFDDYSGENFVIGKTRDTPSGTLVMTELTRPQDTSVMLNYVMRDNGAGSQQVVDVFLTGTISELATRRSEFGAVLQRDGFIGLLALLEKKTSDQSDP